MSFTYEIDEIVIRLSKSQLVQITERKKNQGTSTYKIKPSKSSPTNTENDPSPETTTWVEEGDLLKNNESNMKLIQEIHPRTKRRREASRRSKPGTTPPPPSSSSSSSPVSSKSTSSEISMNENSSNDSKTKNEDPSATKVKHEDDSNIEESSSPKSKKQKKIEKGGEPAKKRRRTEKNKSSSKTSKNNNNNNNNNNSNNDSKSINNSSLTKIKPPELNLKIPLQLKRILVSNYKEIMRNDKRVILPRKPNVQNILHDFIEEYSECPDHDIYAAVGNGLEEYFNGCLGELLLYNKERPQFSQHRRKKGKSLSQIYGAEHLLRLFVKLPFLIRHTRMDDDAVTAVHDKMTDLFKFLQSHTEYFDTPYK